MEGSLKEKLLMLQESDFAADDIKLYLDTHPNDAVMIMKLYMQLQKSMLLRNEIETRYAYPLSASSASVYGAPFKWIASPWPWNSDWPGTAKAEATCNMLSDNSAECIENTETEGCK